MRIPILTDCAVGGTFLTWSLHFLAGHQQHYIALKDIWAPLIGNPLTGRNAHAFVANQALNRMQYHEINQMLQGIEPQGFHTIYMHDFPCFDDTKEIIQQISTQHDQIILVSSSRDQYFYHCSMSWRLDHNDQDHWAGKFQEYFDKFYGQDIKTWENADLVSIWDRREFLALNLRPLEFNIITDYISKITTNFYVLDSRELWTNIDLSVPDLFDWLGIDLDQERYNKWKPVYHEWKTLHHDRLRFHFYFEKIMDAILKGHYIDLSRFNLDLIQEAVIQHYLIYQHGLNIKTWQLEKFVDTLQLHQLLESNQHPVAKIYG